MADDKLALEQIGKQENLVAWRKANRDDDWQYLAQYALPQESNITTSKTEGVSGWTDRIFDTTIIQAAQTLGSGLFNWWTPPNQPWAEYDTPEELKKEGQQTDDGVTKFLGKASDRAMKELARSNFYPVKATGDVGLAVFSTDLIIADESDTGSELFNFIHCQAGTYTIEENYKGLVDTARREIEMTYRQVCQKFSKQGDTIPDKMEEQSKGAKGRGKKFKILHCIFPREDSERLPGRKDGANLPIASVYISVDFKSCLRVSGYHESPILCRRFAKWVSPYGYGPGYLALPDARQVNYVQQYLDALAELHAYPRVLIPDNLEGDVDLRAGGTTTWDTGNPEGKPAEWATVGDYKLGLEMQAQRRQAIKDAFFVDAFKLLNSQPLLDKEMTAYEISQRQAEQLQNIGSVNVRSVPEFINPLMQRVFGIMFRAGKLGNAPQGLMVEAGGGKQGLALPEVVVTSRFNDALRALKNRGAEETFGFISKLPGAEQHPEYLDPFDMMGVIKGYARNAGMAPDDLASDTGPGSIQAKQQARADLMKQQRAAQQAEQLSKSAKNLGGAPDWAQEAVQDKIAPAKGGRKAA